MKEKINYHEHDEVNYLPNISNVASANESTGMMPTPAQNLDEYQNYQELSSMAIPKKAPGKTKHPKKITVKPSVKSERPYL